MSNDKRKEKRQKELVNLGRQAKEISARLDEQIDKNHKLAQELHSALGRIQDDESTRIALAHATDTIEELREKLTASQDEAMKVRISNLELVDLLEKYRERIGELKSLEKENTKLRKRLRARSEELDNANTTISRLKTEMSDVC